MEFTVLFIKAFTFMIVLSWPLMSSLVLTIVLMGQMVGRLEKWTPFNSLYWTFITATTVGYGDIRPARKASRVLAILIAFVGLIFTGILVSIAVATTTHIYAELVDVDQVKQELDRILSDD